MRPLNRLFLLLLLGALGSGHAALAQGLPCHPLPVEINDRYEVSGIFLCLQGEEIGQPLSSFQSTPGGTAEAALHGVVQAVLKNQLDTFRALSADTEQQAVENQFDLYRQALSETADPLVVERFDLPGMVYFLLDAGSEDFPIVPVLLRPAEDGFLQAFSLAAHPVSQNVSAMVRARKAQPGVFAAVADPATTERILLPPPFDPEAEEPLEVRFDGSQVAFQVPPGNEGNPTYAAPTGEVLQFYRAALAELERATLADHQAFLSLLGEPDRQEIARFISTLGEQEFENFKASRTHFREVSYVLDGGDVWFLFYQGVAGEYLGDALKYHVVYRSPDQGLRWVHLVTGGTVETLLEWEELAPRFIDGVINRKTAQ